MKPILFLIVLFINGTWSFKLLIPPNTTTNDSKGCEITEGKMFGLTCVDAKSDSFYKVLSYFLSRKRYLKQIYLRAIAVKSLPENFLGNNDIQTIGLEMNRLCNVSQNAFKGVGNTTEVLYFVANLFFKSIPTEMLHPFKKLTHFGFLISSLTEVKAHLFKGMSIAKTVTNVDLSQNDINTIEKDAFLYMENLRNLDLAGNDIITLISNILPTGQSKFSHFILNNNRLSSIPNLDGLPEGTYLDLGNNGITTLEDGELEVMLNKKLRVNLLGNDLNCDCNFQILVTTDQRYNIEGRCHTPDYLDETNLFDLTYEDFNNC